MLPSQAPGYFTVVSKPMDFTTLKSRLMAGLYGTSWDALEADITLMFTNALAYNATGV